MTIKNNSNQIVIQRIFDADIRTVWAAWTELEQVTQWWGPRGFSITTHHKDLRPGGTWEYTMHGPDGTDYPNKTFYHQVQEPFLLEYDHGANDDRPALFRVAVIFTELNGKTKMDMSMTLPTAEEAQQTKEFIKKAGGNSTWDRLAEFITKKESDKEVFAINRSFDTPIDLMFEVWIDPKHFSKWLAPTGFTMNFIRAQVKEGGDNFYSMSNSEGLTMYGKIKYLKIQRPDLIVYTQQFCDDKENISRHPMAPTWPETMLTKVNFISEGLNLTRVSLTWEVFGEASEAERSTFAGAKSGMTQGWTGSFDKLEEYIQKQG